MDKSIHNTQDEKAPNSDRKQENKNGTNEQIVMAEEKILKDDTDTKERVHKENLKNKMKSREMLIKSLQKLDYHQLVIDNKDNTSEFRPLPSSSDKQRVSLVLPSKHKEHEYDNRFSSLQNVSNSSTSGSSDMEPFWLLTKQEQDLAGISYSDKPKFRVSMNDVTSSMFASKITDTFEDQNEIEYISIHLEDCRMFLLFPVYKRGALRRKERIHKQNVKNEKKGREMMTEGSPKHEVVNDCHRLVNDSKDNISECRERVSCSHSRRVFSNGPNEGCKKECDKRVASLRTVPKHSSSGSLDMEPSLFYKSQEKERVHKENLKNKMKSREMMIEGPHKHEALLDCHQQVIDNKDNTSEFRPLPSSSDKERVSLVLPSKDKVHEYDNRFSSLQNVSNSSTSGSSDMKPFRLLTKQEQNLAGISYSDMPKFRVSMNDVTSSMFASKQTDTFVDQNEIDYIPIHLEDCRMFLLFPVYKGGALRRKEKIHKQNVTNKKKGREMTTKGSPKYEAVNDCHRLVTDSEDNISECRERVSCSHSRRVFSSGPNEGCKKECDKRVASLRTVPKHSSSGSLDMEPSLFYKSQEKERVHKENLKNKMNSRQMMIEGPHKHEAVLDCHQQVIDNKDNTSGIRQLPSSSDKERVSLVLPSKGKEHEYGNRFSFLQNVSNSSTSGSSDMKPFRLLTKQEQNLAGISYSDKPKFRVRMNDVTISMFASKITDTFLDQNEIEYIPIHLEDCRMFLLFPVYKGGALRRKEKIHKQNVTNKKKGMEMTTKSSPKYEAVNDCHRLVIDSKDNITESRERVSCSLSRRMFSNGSNEGCKKECDKRFGSLQTVPKHSSSGSLDMEPSLFHKSQEIGRVHKENLKNKMNSRQMMIEGLQKHEAVLDCHQQVVDNKDNTCELRERVSLHPSENSEKEFDGLVTLLQKSSTSNSLKKESVSFLKRQEKLSAPVSYLEKPKFRVRINVVTSSMFESALREIPENSVEVEYQLVHVKEKRMFVLLPIYKGGVLIRKRKRSIQTQVEWRAFEDKQFGLGNYSQSAGSNRTTVGRGQGTESACVPNVSEHTTTSSIPENNSFHRAYIFTDEMLQAALNTVYSETARLRIDSVQYKNPMFRREN